MISMNTPRSLSIGVDVGGTFTDVYATDAAGDSWSCKVASTPDVLSGILRGLDEAIGRYGHLESLSLTVGHTVALNALLERRGPNVALVTTQGFRDVLDIGREARHHLYDLAQCRPEPLVPVGRRFEVLERIASSGEILVAPHKEQVDEVCAAVRAAGVPVVAVSLLHSYANPVHELLVRDWIHAALPGLDVLLSHEILREYREYERTTLTVMNAYVHGTLHQFMNRLHEEVQRKVPDSAVFVMDSAGGAMSTESARSRAILTALSGPAAGVRGATAVASRETLVSDFITMDMGGTSCDVALVESGSPVLTRDAQIGDFPLRLRALAVDTVGAGGGSIAWVDAGGLLRVGPQSSGAIPGPACYGLGGTDATVTDAHVVLGHLRDGQPLGQDVCIDRTLAIEAVLTGVAEPLGTSVPQAADGILAVARSSMARGLEKVSVRRGRDPRTLTLVAFGGAGGLHACALARELHIASILVPADAGVLSAFGAVSADERYEMSRTVLLQTDEAAMRIADVATELQTALLGEFRTADRADVRTDWFVDARYVGQGATLSIPLPVAAVSAADLRGWFERAYEAEFGYRLTRPVEVETVRVVATRSRSLLRPAAVAAHRAGTDMPRDTDAATSDLPRRLALSSLAVEEPVSGPLVIDTTDTSVLLDSADTALVTKQGDLLITLRYQ